jgi:hypothetical protein
VFVSVFGTCPIQHIERYSVITAPSVVVTPNVVGSRRAALPLAEDQNMYRKPASHGKRTPRGYDSRRSAPRVK